ncbi:nascent polypeptide-associated complex subunit alpha, muscle-specific form-like isoform X2 [Argopecten irradians]|uniref:nascent polypeptide-associated complex subunit alpha, muscle-specific form-like isoform X2 n=1 Tax=Argopecten irradians TaxID=31199 RepID=UPI0037122A65
MSNTNLWLFGNDGCLQKFEEEHNSVSRSLSGNSIKNINNITNMNGGFLCQEKVQRGGIQNNKPKEDSQLSPLFRDGFGVLSVRPINKNFLWKRASLNDLCDRSHPVVDKESEEFDSGDEMESSLESMSLIPNTLKVPATNMDKNIPNTDCIMSLKTTHIADETSITPKFHPNKSPQKRVPPNLKSPQKSVPPNLKSPQKNVPPNLKSPQKNVPPNLNETQQKSVPPNLKSPQKSVPPNLKSPQKSVPPNLKSPQKNVPPNLNETQQKSVPPNLRFPQKSVPLNLKSPQKSVTPNPNEAPQKSVPPNLNETPQKSVPPNLNETQQKSVTPNLKSPQKNVPPNLNETQQKSVPPNLRFPQKSVPLNLKSPQKSVTPNPNEAPQKSVPPNLNETPQKSVPPNLNETQQKSVTPNLNETPQKSVPPNLNETQQKSVTPNLNKSLQKHKPPNLNETQQKSVTPNLNETLQKTVTPDLNKATQKSVTANQNEAPHHLFASESHMEISECDLEVSECEEGSILNGGICDKNFLAKPLASSSIGESRSYLRLEPIVDEPEPSIANYIGYQNSASKSESNTDTLKPRAASTDLEIMRQHYSDISGVKRTTNCDVMSVNRPIVSVTTSTITCPQMSPLTNKEITVKQEPMEVDSCTTPVIPCKPASNTKYKHQSTNTKIHYEKSTVYPRNMAIPTAAYKQKSSDPDGVRKHNCKRSYKRTTDLGTSNSCIRNPVSQHQPFYGPLVLGKPSVVTSGHAYGSHVAGEPSVVTSEQNDLNIKIASVFSLSSSSHNQAMSIQDIADIHEKVTDKSGNKATMVTGVGGKSRSSPLFNQPICIKVPDNVFSDPKIMSCSVVMHKLRWKNGRFDNSTCSKSCRQSFLSVKQKSDKKTKMKFNRKMLVTKGVSPLSYIRDMIEKRKRQLCLNTSGKQCASSTLKAPDVPRVNLSKLKIYQNVFTPKAQIPAPVQSTNKQNFLPFKGMKIIIPSVQLNGRPDLMTLKASAQNFSGMQLPVRCAQNNINSVS